MGIERADLLTELIPEYLKRAEKLWEGGQILQMKLKHYGDFS